MQAEALAHLRSLGDQLVAAARRRVDDARGDLSRLARNVSAAAERVTITSRVFVVLQLVFGIGFSALALLTRRWVFAWIALCGSAVSCFAGLLAWWSRNTPGVSGEEPPSGVGIGLIIGWVAMFVITFHWSRVVWARTNYQLALEAQRRDEAAAEEERALALQRRTSERRRESRRSEGDDL